MGKKLLEFENALIDVRDIKQISRTSSYNRDLQRMEWNIEINDKLPEGKTFVPTFKFSFNSEDYRDSRYEILKMTLEDLEEVEILYTN